MSIDRLWAAFQWDSPVGRDSPTYLRHCGHVAKPTQLKSLDSKKRWLHVQGLTNFKVAHFDAMFHKVSSAKIPWRPLLLEVRPCQSFPKIHDHTLGSEQRSILTNVKYSKAPVLSPRIDKNNAQIFCLLIRVSIFLCSYPSVVSTIPKHLNSTWFSAVPLLATRTGLDFQRGITSAIS